MALASLLPGFPSSFCFALVSLPSIRSRSALASSSAASADAVSNSTSAQISASKESHILLSAPKISKGEQAFSESVRASSQAWSS